MRVIICGAGQVGYSIAAYLAKEENDVTVIDVDPHLIAQINDDLDVNGLVGYASNPEVLSQAGAGEADLIVSVTHSDEINMVSCQVAHSLFNVPKKIARVREQGYLDPAWSNLFSRFHMPIDVIISPEIEVAQAIDSRLSVPGTTNVLSLADGRVYLVGVICKENCPLVNTPLKQLGTLFPDLSIEIGAILRGAHIVVPKEDDQMQIGDEVYFFVDVNHLERAMTAFGHEEKEARSVVIVGGGNIGLYLTGLIQKFHKGTYVKIIEKNKERAVYLSEVVDKDVVVLHGDALERTIIEEADIKDTETVVAVTDDDETNILGSLLSKQQGCERVITLVNKPSYMPMMNSLGIDATVSPRATTVATIMQHVRRGRVKALHNIREGIAEVLEVEVSETASIVNIPLEQLDLSDEMMIGMIVRDGEVIMPTPEAMIRPNDHVMILAKQSQTKNVEKLFMVQVDLF
jgi:trk system potassium uptake protein TrkA